MPSWLLQLLISLAIKIGVPALVKYFPKVPAEVIAIINDLLDSLKKPDVSNSMAKKTAILKVREQLQSSPNESETKKS